MIVAQRTIFSRSSKTISSKNNVLKSLRLNNSFYIALSLSMYCCKHRPLQIITRNFKQSRKNIECPICYQKIETQKDPRGVSFLGTPCCQSFMHRDCLQKHAFSAGLYFFKCPLCNNKDEFVKEMLEFGIHLPEK